MKYSGTPWSERIVLKKDTPYHVLKSSHKIHGGKLCIFIGEYELGPLGGVNGLFFTNDPSAHVISLPVETVEELNKKWGNSRMGNW